MRFAEESGSSAETRTRERSAYAAFPLLVLVVPKTTPGYAGGKKIASSEEWRRQEKSSLLD